MSVDIEKLEELTKAISPLPWRTNGWCIHDANRMIPVADIRSEKARDQENARYIVAACNAVPELIAENRDLQKRVQELEKQRNWLAQKHAIACIDAACDACTSHIGDCPICPLPQGTGLCIEVSEVTFINAAEDATKEAVKKEDSKC